MIAENIRNIMVFLHGHSVSTSRAVRMFKTYGEDAIEKVRSDPYRLGAGSITPASKSISAARRSPKVTGSAGTIRHGRVFMHDRTIMHRRDRGSTTATRQDPGFGLDLRSGSP